jgi:hypothetical protein
VIRGPGLANVDLSLVKAVDIRERLKLQLRIELFDAFNHPVFNSPSVVANVPGFGSITSTIATGTPNRQSQFALKLVF